MLEYMFIPVTENRRIHIDEFLNRYACRAVVKSSAWGLLRKPVKKNAITLHVKMGN